MTPKEQKDFLQQIETLIIRHVGACYESLRDEMKILAEGLTMLSERQDRHEKKTDMMMKTMAKMQADIFEIKEVLTTKADRSELVALEGRVGVLESVRV